MAVITIDGRDIEVLPNKNVLDCALDAGIYIPHLCHHPNLQPLGACRMCIVEVEGRDGVVSSCDLKSEDGMKIHTVSDEVKRLRRLALELLLAGHPEDCTTCGKYGNCELQTLIQYIGPRTGRLKMRAKGFKTEDGNPLFIHEMNRCVLCGRCVRACNELRGVKILRYQKRGMETYVGTVQQKFLTDAGCRFCGACAEVCPTGTIRDKPRVSGVVPCRNACPAHTDIPRYIRYASQGRYDEAAAVVREKLPFPKILGYICNHVCEPECKRKEINEAMSIRNIKRYAAEQDTGAYWKGKGKQLPSTGKKVCVVGAGPTGMTAAYYLRKQGHDVTIKEALPAPGGMLMFGIPSYRLPREIILEEAGILWETGVKLETNTKVEKPRELLNIFDAVLMATGAHLGIRLPIEGGNLPGVILNLEFLRNVNLGKETGLGERVIVLGGGNVAFDCARTAKRLGAEDVHVACLEARDQMTSDEDEIEQAAEEGILIHPGQTFERVTGETYVTGVDFMDVKSFAFDENRRAVIEKVENSAHHIDADTVIFAVGQRTDIGNNSGLDLDRGSRIVTENGKAATGQKDIFAAGDAVYGTKSVIMAIAAGRDAATEIDRYLGGDGNILEVLAPVEIMEDYIGEYPGFASLKREHTAILPLNERKGNFRMVDQGLCGESICKETSRCLKCDLRERIAKPRLWGDYTKVQETAEA
jgi:NADPH-dependent glutamate synthase beta subunit-like oxidoreductase/ferredoxin